MFFENRYFKSYDGRSDTGVWRHAVLMFHSRTMATLLIADMLLVTLHASLGFLILAGATSTFPEILRIDRDWSLGEVFNYFKWLALIGTSLALFYRKKSPIFLAIAIVCVVALLDDSLQLHESFSGPLTDALAFGWNWPRGTGELVFMAATGMLIAGPLIYGWRRSSHKVREQIVPLLTLFGGAIFCAGGIDFLHGQMTAVAPNSIKAGILGIIEDGGEMVFLSLMVSYVVGLISRSKPAAD